MKKIGLIRESRSDDKRTPLIPSHIKEILNKYSGLKIIVHKKKCNTQQKCMVKKISSALEAELQVAILRKAVIFEKEYNAKNRKKRSSKGNY